MPMPSGGWGPLQAASNQPETETVLMPQAAPSAPTPNWDQDATQLMVPEPPRTSFQTIPPSYPFVASPLPMPLAVNEPVGPQATQASQFIGHSPNPGFSYPVVARYPPTVHDPIPSTPPPMSSPADWRPVLAPPPMPPPLRPPPPLGSHPGGIPPMSPPPLLQAPIHSPAAPPSHLPPVLPTAPLPAPAEPLPKRPTSSPRILHKVILTSGVLACALVAGFVSYRFLPSNESGGSENDDMHMVFPDFQLKNGSVIVNRLINESGNVLFSFESNLKSKSDDWAVRGFAKSGEVLAFGYLFSKGPERILVDRFGKKTKNPIALPIRDFSEGLMAVHPLDRIEPCSYMDRDHKLISPMDYKECSDFHDGMASVKKNGKFGYVDRSGRLVIPPILSTGCPFSDGIVNATLDGERVFLNREGKKAFDATPIADCAGFGDGLAPAMQAGKVGYINLSGRFVIPAIFDQGGPFASGRAFVRSDGQIQLIDLSGKQIVIPQLEDAKPFQKGLAVAIRDGKAGLMKTNGQWALEPTVYAITSLQSGLWSYKATPSSLPEYLDEAGRRIDTPSPTCLEYLHGIFYCVEVEGLKPNASADEVTQALFIAAMKPELLTMEYWSRSGTLLSKNSARTLLGR